MKNLLRLRHSAWLSALLLACIAAVGVATSQQAPDLDFRDDFTGTTLNPRWKLLKADDDRWTLVDGDYFMSVTTHEGTNVMEYTGDLPNDYEVIVKVQTPPQQHNQVVRLSLWKDDENLVEVGYYSSYHGCVGCRNVDTEVYLQKVLRGEQSNIYKSVSRHAEDAPLFLKLSKTGVEYTGAYSSDGTAWLEVGSHVLLSPEVKPHFDAYNYYGHGTPPESGIRFDFFEIKQ